VPPSVNEPVGNSSRDMQGLGSKTAFVAELVPRNRKLVEFSVELANTPGDLAKVAMVLSDHNVNVLTGFHDAKRWSFFADVTDIESSVDEIVKEISSLSPVSKVSLGKEVSEGIIVDTLHKQMAWGPFRTIIVRADVMSSILERVKGIFGAEGAAGKAIVHGMGEAAGRAAFKGIANTISAETMKAQFENLIQMYTAQGWGDFKLASLDLNRITASVTVVSGFECAHEAASSTTCDFVRGHLTGIFSEAFGKRMCATETLCAARGNAKCHFAIASSGTGNEVKQ